MPTAEEFYVSGGPFNLSLVGSKPNLLDVGLVVGIAEISFAQADLDSALPDLFEWLSASDGELLIEYARRKEEEQRRKEQQGETDKPKDKVQ